MTTKKIKEIATSVGETIISIAFAMLEAHAKELERQRR